MALSGHLKTLLAGARRLPRRFISFSTPEEAATARRSRLTNLGVPLSFLRQTPPPQPNPSTPKRPEPVSALSGKRLELHNKILKLIYDNDTEEAALFTKHSVYSNCPPTIFTVDAVMSAQLRQSKYGDLLALHRFVIQAGIAPTVTTYNLVFRAYLDSGRPDTALEYYKQMVNAAPFNPSPSTYRVLIKGLVDNGMVDRALELRGEVVELKGFSPDPLVYHYLMTGLARNKDADGIFELFEEFKEKAGVFGDGVVEDGRLYGGLMNGFFMKGMEKEAMECYENAVGENSKVRMSDVAYTSVLDALATYGKFEEVLGLFDRMLREHNYPMKVTVNSESFSVIVDWYCGRGSFKDAIEVFRKMESYRCVPDVRSFNNLIGQLCANGLLVEAEEVYGEMDGRGVKPNEDTLVMLMDACFKVGRTDNGAAYFKKMVDLELPCSLAVYSRLVDHLVNVGKLDDAKSFYDLMVKKLKMDSACYKFMMGALSDAGRLGEMLKMVDEMLDDETIGFNEELQEFARGELRKEGREEDLGKLMEEKERQKAEAKAREIEEIEAAKRSTRAAFASIFQATNLGSIEEVSSSADAISKDGEILESAQQFSQE